MEEIWRDIGGYEGIYQISNTGKIKSFDKFIIRGNNSKPSKILGRIMKQAVNVRGYWLVCLTKNNIERSECPHRLVALTFVPNPDNLPWVNHKDHNKLNNNDWNLEWSTVRENTVHSQLFRGKKSKYPGVSFDGSQPNQKWRVRICENGKRTHIGRFSDEKSAHEAYRNGLLNRGIVNKYAA